MVVKDIYLRKKLIRTGSIAAIILVVLGAAAWGISDMEDSATAEKAQKEGENSQISSDYEEIKNLLGEQFQISNAYNQYIKSHNKNFTLNREEAATLLTQLSLRHHLTNSTIAISPIQPASAVPFTLKTYQLVSSDVSLSFGAVTDSSVYHFIEDAEQSIPGVILVRELKLTHVATLSRETLVDLSNHKITPLVTGEITFLWIGLQPKPDKNSGTNRKPNG